MIITSLQIYVEGSPEVPRDYAIAIKYFKRGIELVSLLHGLDVNQFSNHQPSTVACVSEQCETSLRMSLVVIALVKAFLPVEGSESLTRRTHKVEPWADTSIPLFAPCCCDCVYA